jgi:3-oxoacyl-[acyl-carrier protein] reductase
VALITGAAGGLGRALVAEFARQGWRVVAACHRQPAQPETDTVWPLPLDVTDRAQVTTAVARVLQRWGAIRLLVNNAGLTADQPVWQMSEADWDSVLAVNLKGAFLCSQAVLPAMMQQGDGQIINVASFSARQGARGQANYAAAKAGLLGLTQSLAKEVGASNVRVNAVLPGVLPTPMTASLGAKRLAALAQMNALGRLNSVAEVARFVVFLASCANISGQLFQLDSRLAPWS